MKLYHLSNNIEEIEKFKPRIPKFYDKKETCISRISLSTSIGGCIAATLYTWFADNKKFKILNGYSQKEKINKKEATFVDFIPFTEARLYEFDLEVNEELDIVFPKDVKNKYNVFDAEINGEHWILNSTLKPTSSKIIHIKSMKCLIEHDFWKGRLMEYTHVYKVNFKEIDNLDKYLKSMDEHYNYDYIDKHPKKCFLELYARMISRDCNNIVNNLTKEKIKVIESVTGAKFLK